MTKLYSVGITSALSAFVHICSGFVKMLPSTFANPSSYLIFTEVISSQ